LSSGAAVTLATLIRERLAIMKILVAIGMTLVTALACAVDKPAAPAPSGEVVKGSVLEVKDVESYTYLRLKTKNGETWAAVGKTPVQKGSEVTLENVTVMTNFESKTLKKTFPTILFANLAGKGANASYAGNEVAAAHAGLTRSVDAGDIRVDKAKGANARTIAEIVGKAAELKDKPVLVRGKVVKFNAEIMGKNWVHLRDGSGSAADGSNDLLVTTAGTAKVGDVVTAQGVVHTNADFGSGYTYKVLVEEATLQP
jgi:hypothetical protein